MVMGFYFRFEILQNTIKGMRNSMNINDIAKIMTGIFINYSDVHDEDI